ncbi:hypothetical protein LXL04_000429 [Taraxacum kok-saghyz]
MYTISNSYNYENHNGQGTKEPIWSVGKLKRSTADEMVVCSDFIMNLNCTDSHVNLKYANFIVNLKYETFIVNLKYASFIIRIKISTLNQNNRFESNQIPNIPLNNIRGVRPGRQTSIPAGVDFRQRRSSFRGTGTKVKPAKFVQRYRNKGKICEVRSEGFDVPELQRFTATEMIAKELIHTGGFFLLSVLTNRRILTNLRFLFGPHSDGDDDAARRIMLMIRLGGVASPSPSPSLSLSTRQASLTTPSPHAVVVAVAKGGGFVEFSARLHGVDEKVSGIILGGSNLPEATPPRDVNFAGGETIGIESLPIDMISG